MLLREVERIGERCIKDGVFMAGEFTKLLNEELPPKALLRRLEMENTSRMSVLPRHIVDMEIDSSLKLPKFELPPINIEDMKAAIETCVEQLHNKNSW